MPVEFQWTSDSNDDDYFCRSVPNYSMQAKLRESGEAHGSRYEYWQAGVLWMGPQRIDLMDGIEWLFHSEFVGVDASNSAAARLLCEMAVLADLYCPTGWQQPR